MDLGSVGSPGLDKAREFAQSPTHALAPPAESAEQQVVRDWLSVNGVNELVPKSLWMEVRGRQLTYLGWAWDGPRGWDRANIRLPATPDDNVMRLRTVRLLAPVTDSLRAAIKSLDGELIEH